MAKFQLTFKDPDGIDDQIQNAAFESEIDFETVYNFANKWIDGEYVTIEFDTDANTAKIIKF